MIAKRRLRPKGMRPALAALFKTVKEHGYTFKPWIVTRDGEIVGPVPGPLDAAIMKCHLKYKEAQREQA
jgi:hypothetical protein